MSLAKGVEQCAVASQRHRMEGGVTTAIDSEERETGSESESEVDRKPAGKASRDEVFRQAMKAESIERGMAIIREAFPSYSQRYLQRIRRALEEHHRDREGECFRQSHKDLPILGCDKRYKQNIKIEDRGLWSYGKRCDEYLILETDSTDHLYVKHSLCGRAMELRLENEVLTGPHYKIQRLFIRCAYCKTPWDRWRKSVLDGERGEHTEGRQPPAKKRRR